ncbi:alpha/beta hydrolase [Nocardioides sp. cx-173]|uniref:alpha/beta hydrolase n=1 Tax=Nocardioides sp. cx-173 TaxID=2898796 RepID=UPI001E47B53B|nr:alpha/beta hydrolase [Nocardioides sp. cx-173]MCD4523338.1 alpha/beta hydrolase [Nocardioides sp. cx-173]UGB42322.1 alpha/beta hydrolase [Nocardioides sp. cx-173]
MPSRRHQLLVWALPRLRGSQELDDVASERARVEQWHATLPSSLPTRAVPRFDRRYTLTTETLQGPDGDFTSYTVTPRGLDPDFTLYYLHGGGFMAPADPFQVRYVVRLATELRARVVIPDYPLTPEHTVDASHLAVADHVSDWAQEGPLVLLGDSAGGGFALAVAETLRDRGGPQPARMALFSPWVDLSTSTAEETEALDAVDPWLFIGKLRTYAEWWAGGPERLTRHEASPALAPLDGLPPTLMFCGTRDLLVPGCRLLARRAQESDWDLTYIEEPGLLHVYPLLPLIPEAKRAWRQLLAWLG